MQQGCHEELQNEVEILLMQSSHENGQILLEILLEGDLMKLLNEVICDELLVLVG